MRRGVVLMPASQPLSIFGHHIRHDFKLNTLLFESRGYVLTNDKALLNHARVRRETLLAATKGDMALNFPPPSKFQVQVHFLSPHYSLPTRTWRRGRNRF